jgi:ATP-dependent Clp protease ATP-binding subunit ClpA
MFEPFSDRARRIVFYSRRLAGRQGASAIEAEHLIEALLLEDQAEYAQMFPENAVPGTSTMAFPAHRPFFTPEVAAEIQRGLEPLVIAKGEPLPESVDMPLSDAAKHVLMGGKELIEQLDGAPATPSRIRTQHVQPLHLLAAALSDEGSASAEVLKRAGVAKKTVIAAIKSGEYS